MALRFYNTLTQQTEEFKPLNDNVVKMYTCGPTVYNFVHIGNLRAFTAQDILSGEGSQIADVDEVINGRPAGVHLDDVVVEGFEFLGLLGQSVVEPQGHRGIFLS